MIYHCPPTVRIKAIQGVLPEFTASAREQFLAEGVAPEKLEQYLKKFGYDCLHFLLPPDTVSDMMAPALHDFFAREGLDTDSIDNVISITCSPDYFLPGNSFRYHKELKLSQQCHCLDMNSTCASFINALYTGFNLIAGGSSKRVLLVYGDCMRLVDFYSYGRREHLLSDGGAIVLLERCDATEEDAAAAATGGAIVLLERCDATEEDAAAAATGGAAVNPATSFGFDILSQFYGHTVSRIPSMREPTKSQLEDHSWRVAPAQQTEDCTDPALKIDPVALQKIGPLQGTRMALKYIVQQLRDLLTYHQLTLDDVACGLMHHTHQLVHEYLTEELINACQQEATKIQETGGFAWFDLKAQESGFAKYKNFFPFVSRDIGHMVSANIPVTISLHQKELPNIQQKPLFCCAFGPGLMVNSALLHLENTHIHDTFIYEQKLPAQS